MYEIDEKREALEIQARYEELIEACNEIRPLTEADRATILRAFTIARNAHEGTRRKSGEPYIFHPLAVALIAVKEVNLGPTAVVSALLHDVVEDTDITVEQLRKIFGDRVARIVDGVTKIDTASRITLEKDQISKQAENYRKILLAMCDDVYVIFVKLCDRLHNMRTLGSMKDTKKLAISSETQYIFIPLAHRLGLYNIKTELEELVMKYTNPVPYAEISEQIAKTSGTEALLKDCFTMPIRQLLDEHGIKYTIKTRVKSVFSCWKKIQNKGVSFEEIYDLYAMRIIIDVPLDREKEECFKVYALISKLFPPNPTRFRDWITTPKNNGYESLQTTVMSPIGRWVEVQIRTVRMDQIAEKGMAAHFLYKEAHPEEHIEGNPVEEWLQQIRSSLENSEKSALDLVEEFKETLYTKEIYLFSPKGESIKLPSGSTVLDFAYTIHSDLGHTCMGAKVNAKVVPIDYKLHSGEQVQILTSRKTHPDESWLSIAHTSRAKEHIKDYLRLTKRQYKTDGEKRLNEYFNKLGIGDSTKNVPRLCRFFNIDNELELYFRLATGLIIEKDIAQCFGLAKRDPHLFFLEPYEKLFERDDQSKLSASIKTANPERPSRSNPFLLDKDYGTMIPVAATCCKPVQGDEVVGLLEDDKIVVHRTNCPHAMHEMSTHEDRTVRAKWNPGENVSFLAGISLLAIDRKGLLQEITQIVSEEMNINMRAITLEASEGVDRGIIMFYVDNLDNLNNLMEKLRALENVERVQRI